MSTSYISHLEYLASPTGLETASLLGNSLRLSSAVVAGATSLPVEPAGYAGTDTSVDVTQFQIITIYDGLNTEQVLVSADTTFPASSIPVMAPVGASYTGCQFAHAQYTPCSSPGTLGDLGAQILAASAWMDNKCKQSQWSTSQSENIAMPTMRASIDNQGALVFRPKQYPVTAITSIYLGETLTTLTQYDQTQAVIDVNELVKVNQLLPIGTASSQVQIPWIPPFRRATNAWCQVTYTAGYTAANLPMDIKDACILRTSALLARRQNPTAADSLRLGDKQIQATQRGDNSPYTLLSKEALDILAQYTIRAF